MSSKPWTGHNRTATPIIDPKKLAATLAQSAQLSAATNRAAQNKGPGRRTFKQIQEERKKEKAAKKSKKPGGLSSLPSEENDEKAGAVADPSRFSTSSKDVDDVTAAMQKELMGAADEIETAELLDGFDEDEEALKELDNLADEDGDGDAFGQAGDSMGSLGALKSSRPAFNPSGSLLNKDGSTRKAPAVPKKKRVATPINPMAYLTMKQEATAKLGRTLGNIQQNKPLDFSRVPEWDPDTVKQWGKKNLPEKYLKFWDAGVDKNETTGSELLNMDQNVLKTFGFKVGVFRRNILREIEKLKTQMT